MKRTGLLRAVAGLGSYGAVVTQPWSSCVLFPAVPGPLRLADHSVVVAAVSSAVSSLL